jgi:glycosyltransferase involved in cell wall biosynthesis
VTNDLVFDQRMIRICSSLSAAGYAVTLVGTRFRGSPGLLIRPFDQKRLYCFARKGKLFYAEYNIRLFLFLLFRRMNAICAIDLDTILPCYFVSVFRKIPRVYDAHELFCEMKEVVTRPSIYRAWKKIESFCVPRFKYGYTVNLTIAEEFRKLYNRDYLVIRNMPLLKPLTIPGKKEPYILYQGAVNEGRSFETLIPAMKFVDAPLIICGDGNFMRQAIELTKKHGLENKISFKGKLSPEDLRHYTLHAWAGVTFFENTGISNYYSLGNRFFDYMHAGLPQVCVDYPEYRKINDQYKVAVLTGDLSPENIAEQLNLLLQNKPLYAELQANCLKAREVFNWEADEKKLLELYFDIFQK